MTKMAPFVMIMGAMLTLTALILGFVAASYVEDAIAGDTGDQETLAQFGTYVMPLALTGVAFILMAVTIFLRGIFKGIRLMGTNATAAIRHFTGDEEITPAHPPAAAAAGRKRTATSA